MASSFIDTIKSRRSIYGIDKNVTLSESEIEKRIITTVKNTPSAFNSQSSRIVILFGEQHEKLWNIVKNTLKSRVSADSFSKTEEKINAFQAGFGTVLFFEDTSVIKGLQEKFSLYAENFPIWSEQSTGINQHAVWVALAEAGLGASLQHYNPLIDDAVKSEWDLPTSWNLRAQMPFGNITQAAGEKEFIADEERFRVFK